MSNEGQIRLLDSIQGDNLLVIDSSIEALARPSLNLSNYDVLVVREDETLFVILEAYREVAGASESLGVRHKPQELLDGGELAALLSRMGELAVLDRIKGRSLEAIRVATREFRERRPNTELEQYAIEVVRDGESLVVIFADKDRVPGTRGHNVERPGFEVALDPRSLNVQKAYFTR